MTQAAIVTKWKFVIGFENRETGEISGTLGQAGTREECEGLIEYDTQYQNDHGRTVVDVAAVEICAECEGEGQIRSGKGERIICRACGGHLGPISKLMNGSPEAA